jgi:phenylalanyl-tRNA synthetase alpha chain
MASDLSEKVLQYLDGHENIDTLHLAELLSVDHQKVIGAVKSLQALGDVSVAERIIFRSYLECI